MINTLLKPRQRRRIRDTLYCTGFVFIIYRIFLLAHHQAQKRSENDSLIPNYQPIHQGPHSPSLLANLSLTSSQCAAAFPGLTQPIDDIVSQGPFTLNPDTAPVLGQIRSGQLHILRAQRKNDLSAEMLNSRTASLHQVHRALLTAPPSEPVPDTTFALNFQDQPFGTAWAYSTQADPASRPGANGDDHPDARTFLMPHFSFWAWRLPFIGSMSRAAAAIDHIETALNPTFTSKIPRAVWRGTTWFNSVDNPRLRGDLLAATRDKPWADVEALRWDGTRNGGGRTASNALPIEDFCRYRYVLHTEGVTYSGRFQFLQLCASVVITPPVGWLQHATHLVRPVFSDTLLLPPPGPEEKGRGRGQGQGQGGSRWEPWAPATQRAWPVSHAPEEANIVFVRPDWSDLEDVILWLEDHLDVGEGIARRQRDLFAGGGYYSPAAEVCYWRALVRGWSEVVRVDESRLEGTAGDGQTFEAFVLTNGD
ncbi:hypothetical protein VPNG_06825 [Cytospora leucostoma]|uniref:Glycosyl transferase CAP10 domain-containing protein n=1 Tax=Cytospora leucostoma TaxID=1230097 RepID=A0A423WVW0_9PEZI|nr:hypothetical protein VPNG_06825 [Cytospora leucostoma]